MNKSFWNSKHSLDFFLYKKIPKRDLSLKLLTYASSLAEFLILDKEGEQQPKMTYLKEMRMNDILTEIRMNVPQTQAKR